DSCDRAARPIRVRIGSQPARVIAVAKDDLPVSLQLVERRIVGVVVPLTVCDREPEDLALTQRRRERRADHLGTDCDIAADEPQMLILNQRAWEQTNLGQYLETIADAEDESACERVATNRLHNRSELCERAGAKIVAVRKSSRHDDAVDS